MLLIAIVEDDDDDMQQLKNCVEQYFIAKEEICVIHSFSDGVEFIRSREQYHIVFFDIRMKEMDGLDAAHFLRIINKEAQIIFVTHMAQMAIRGYEVDATDFVIKPAEQFAINRVLDKATKRIDASVDLTFALKTQNGIVSIAARNILFVEIFDHDLIYHTEIGDFKVRGKLGEVRKKLDETKFIQCNRSFLVNMHHIKSIHSDYVLVNDVRIQISKSRQNEIEQRFIKYLGETI